MARVAVTFAVKNLKKTESGRNIWQFIEHFETISESFGAKRVFEEDSKLINDSSALLVFDMSSNELHKGKP